MQQRRSTSTPMPMETLGSGSVEPAPQPQTVVTDIVIPLVQNIIGGGAVTGLGAILGVAISRGQGVLLDREVLTLWCMLAGGAVACSATIVRFFGDDVGLLLAAYRAGQHNMRLRVNALELELQAARTQLARLLGKAQAIPPTRSLQELQRIYKAAQHLIHWHFEQLPIDRRSCEQRNMSQGDWRRARHLLIAAGVMDENGIIAPTLPEALAKAHVHYQKATMLGSHTEKFVSPQ